MIPADARTVANFLAAMFEHEIALTTKVFHAVPDAHLDYRPDAVSRTALELLRHITLEDEWIINAVADGRFAPLPDQSDACGIMAPADAAAQYARRIQASLARVKALPDEALTREVALGELRMPAVAFFSLALQHSVHHRGQLTSYLRAMGGKVPAIYGPSADSVVLQA